MYSRETLERHIAEHEAKIELVSHQLKEDKNKVSAFQLTAWRKYKVKLKKELAALKTKFEKYYPPYEEQRPG